MRLYACIEGRKSALNRRWHCEIMRLWKRHNNSVLSRCDLDSCSKVSGWTRVVISQNLFFCIRFKVNFFLQSRVWSYHCKIAEALKNLF